jgi:hypothetical protein
MLKMVVAVPRMSCRSAYEHPRFYCVEAEEHHHVEGPELGKATALFAKSKGTAVTDYYKRAPVYWERAPVN